MKVENLLQPRLLSLLLFLFSCLTRPLSHSHSSLSLLLSLALFPFLFFSSLLFFLLFRIESIEGMTIKKIERFNGYFLSISGLGQPPLLSLLLSYRLADV
ncbi:hypothetical protein F4810DRAFT_227715 [Camillea tinctor]|nr:hypothetical protein F4810DRAFT_227715 [Camillea tinctor]